jgi:hypothetical protein
MFWGVKRHDFVLKEFSNPIDPAHAIGFHRGYLLTEKDEVETGQRLNRRMVGDVAVYLLACCFVQCFVITRHKARLIHKGYVPEGKVTNDVMLHRFLHIVPLMDKSREWQVGTLADSHNCPREIYVFEIVLHIRGL